MSQLAIKGHPTRGSEVIAFLEMLGGKNIYHATGTIKKIWYMLSDGIIEPSAFLSGEMGFTLEQFLKKFPYKVGDKVKNARINDFIGRVTKIRWDDNEKQIIYTVEWDDVAKSTLPYFARALQPYKEKTLAIEETITIDDFKVNSKEWLIDKLHGMTISDAMMAIDNIHDELHKSKT